jgi:tetratricopeptide (TPR) repeat protein
MEGVWDAQVAAKVHAAFVASKSPLADKAWRGVQQVLDGRRDRWVAARIDACEATNVRGVQSAAGLDLRMACLERRRSETAALIEVLSQADAAVVDRAVRATEMLSTIETCNDADQLISNMPPPPPGPAMDALVATVRADFDHVRALYMTGQVRAVGLRADEALAEARVAGYLPLVAEAERWVGSVSYDLGDVQRSHEMLMRALEDGMASQNDQISGEAACDLAYLAAQVLKRPQEVDLFSRISRAIRERASGNLGLHYAISTNLGHVLYLRNEFTEARAEIDRGLADAITLDGPDSYRVALSLTARGNVLNATDQLDAAMADYRRAAHIIESRYGADHADRGIALYDLGLTLRNAGRYDEALQALTEAQGIFERAGEPINVARCVHNQARTRQAMGQLDKALAGYRAVLEAGEKLVGPDVPELAYPLTGIAAVLRRQGKLAEAEAPLQRAMKLHHAWWGDVDNPINAEALAELGLLELQRGRAAEAAPLLDRVAAVCDHGYCPDVPVAEVNAARARLRR